MQSFQKYQLDDMIAEEEAEKLRAQVIDSLANSTDGNSDALTHGRYSAVIEEQLTDEQKELLEEIREKFDPVEVVTDLCILYEVTNYKDESAESDFWEQYMDFFELGNDENMIRSDKMNVDALAPDRRQEYRSNRESRQDGLTSLSQVSISDNQPKSPLLGAINERANDEED